MSRMDPSRGPSGIPRRPSRVRIFDVADCYNAVFHEILLTVHPARLDVDGRWKLEQAGIPSTLIQYSDSEHGLELSVHEPAQDGASGPLGILGFVLEGPSYEPSFAP